MDNNDKARKFGYRIGQVFYSVIIGCISALLIGVTIWLLRLILC